MDPRPPNFGSSPPRPSDSDRLDSWKEIALHLKRDVRTAQRWEAEGLPVYRHQHGQHGSIYAYRSEIDAWWASRRPPVQRQELQRQERAQNRHDFQGRLQRNFPRYLRFILYAIMAIVIVLAVEEVRRLVQDHFSSRQAQSSRTLTIAVLPFRNLGTDLALTQLGLGITDDVIDDLARAPAFRVLGTASTMRFQNDPEPPWQIARQLRADEVVEGTVTQSGDRIRIAAQLVGEPVDRILWAHEFVRNASDLLSLKKEVARSIATAVETAPMSDRVPAPAPNRRSNADARLNYFKGLRFRRLPLLENSAGLFEAPRQRFRTSASQFAATVAGPDRFPSLPQAAPRKAGLE